jgi:hypothetical protein
VPECRNCKLYDLDAVKDRAGRVRGDRFARCLWKSIEVWPESVSSWSKRPDPGLMPPNETHRCQRFIKRDDAK